MDMRSKAAKRIGGGIFAVSAAVGGYIAIDNSADRSCEELMAQATEQQAELIERLGEDAPNFDFNFPDACFDS